MHGAGGRIIAHLIMLSPTVHSWFPKVEKHLETLSISQHVFFKLHYFKQHVFPIALKDNITDWKKYEPNPFGLSFEKTKKFIRHAWMKETIEELQRFNCSKIAFTDFTDCKYFTIRAVIAKHTFGIADPDPTQELDTWYRKDTPEETREVIVNQLIKADSMLQRWKSYSNVYSINVNKFLLSTRNNFLDEYTKLCKFYEVELEINAALDLWAHWTQLQWKRENRDL
jgi:hypothetical protein